MYSTVRYPRALRFTPENRLLSSSMKAVVEPGFSGPGCPPVALRSSGRLGSLVRATHRFAPALPAPTRTICRTVSGLPSHPSVHRCLHLVGHARHTPFQGHRLQLQVSFPSSSHGSSATSTVYVPAVYAFRHRPGSPFPTPVTSLHYRLPAAPAPLNGRTSCWPLRLRFSRWLLGAFADLDGCQSDG
jgi:hypothetical protein